jgi:pyroglutamyl-peptidase
MADAGSGVAGGGAEMIVCGFEPFGGRHTNRSWEVALALDAHLPRGAFERGAFERVQLPVDFVALRRIVPGLVARAGRALVLLGEAGGTDAVQVERVGLNVLHARIPDNLGARPEFAEVVANAPLARFARWDAEACARTIAAEGVPVQVSHHAGTYACNAALYLALDAAETAGASAASAASGIRGAAPATIGFIHVPVETPPETPRIAAAIARLLLTFR